MELFKLCAEKGHLKKLVDTASQKRIERLKKREEAKKKRE